MNDTKPWYTSQTIWANIVAVVGVVLTVFHVDFGMTDQATVVTAITEIVTGVAAIWGIIGRLQATHMIGSK